MSGRGRGGSGSGSGNDEAVPPLRALATLLQVEEHDLPRLASDFVAKAMEEDGWSQRLQASALVALDKLKKNQTDGMELPMMLIEEQKRERKLRIEPWRATWELLANAASGLSEPKSEELIAEWAELAKAGSIAQDEAMILHIILILDDEARRTFAAGILRLRGMQRTQLFNFLAASTATEGVDTTRFIDERGDRILQMPWPLWPKQKAFASLLTAEFVAMTAQGGSSTERPLFRSNDGMSERFGGFGNTGNSKKPEGAATATAQGAGYVPVGTLPDGSTAADVTRLESTLAACQRQLKACERRLTEAGLYVKPSYTTNYPMEQPRKGQQQQMGRGGLPPYQHQHQQPQQQTAQVGTNPATTRRARGGDDSGSGQQQQQPTNQVQPQQQQQQLPKDVAAAVAVLRAAGLSPVF